MEATITGQARALLLTRLTQIDQEKGRVERAVEALGPNGSGPRSPGRPKGKPGRKRRKGSTRSTEALRLVQENPGITAGEIAKRMRIKPNYLYRVVGDLEKQGQVKKSGRKFHPAT